MSEEKDDKWEMPKPVFRTTSGALPKRFEETISQSFMPNAETIEIDEDDDILSIHDTPLMPQPKQAESLEGEGTLESETEMAPNIVNSVETSIADGDQPQPIVVTAKQPTEKPGVEPSDSRSNLVIFVLIALIAAAIVYAVLYYRS